LVKESGVTSRKWDAADIRGK